MIQILAILIVIIALLITIPNNSYKTQQNSVQKNIQENFSSDEAIQNLASLYNRDQLTVTNLDVTGKFTLNGKAPEFIPRGIIVAWSGQPTQIPGGWVLCDGQNGTPNLKGRFIYGWSGTGRSATIQDGGGSELVTLTVAQIPAHTHSMQVDTTSGWAKSSIGSGEFNKRTDQTGSTGGGQAHENMPPFLVLAYIMKI